MRPMIFLPSHQPITIPKIYANEYHLMAINPLAISQFSDDGKTSQPYLGLDSACKSCHNEGSSGGVIADELNKQFKHQKVAYFLEEGGNPTDVTGWISTGSTMLDLAIAIARGKPT